MNTKYTYIDGNIIIMDEKDNQRLDEYYDNLEEVLIQENVIESMENQIQKLETRKKEYNKNRRKHYIPVIAPIGILLIIFFAPALLYFTSGEEAFISSIDTVFGAMSIAKFTSLVISILFIPLAVLGDLFYYNIYKNECKDEKGIISELEFLRNQIILEKEKLEKLKQERKRKNENKQFRVVEINDKKRLEIIKSWLSLYYELGYNGKKYYKLYRQGFLEKKLRKQGYTDIAIGATKEYIEEKGPILAKRK